MALSKQLVKGKSGLWEVVVGLEVHAQLLTKTKLFSPAAAATGVYTRPNTLVHPFDAAVPGTYPQLNAKAVELAVRAALLLGSRVNRESRFERKHYFYNDLPHGYQITQQRFPIASGGGLHYRVPSADGEQTPCKTAVTRIQLEMDSGKTVHDSNPQHSYVDLNRAGCGLIEIVFEPDIYSSTAASSAVKSLQELLRFADICDGNMAEGSLRCDINVSVELPESQTGQKVKGGRVEVKNVNSFKFIAQAIDFEAQRQVDLLERGESIIHETRGFDPRTGETRRQRDKEGAVDYRFFFDPDLPPLIVADELIEKVRSNLPETPEQMRQRLMNDYQLSHYDADVIVSSGATKYFEHLCVNRTPKTVTNWLCNNLLGFLNKLELSIDKSPVSSKQLGDLIDLVTAGSLSGTAGQSVLEELMRSNDHPDVRSVVERMGLTQITDEAAIRAVCQSVVDDPAHQKQVATYLKGKENLFMFLLGRVMKETQGKASPTIANKVLKEVLEQKRASGQQ